MDDNYKTPLIIDAIEMAARNLDLPEGSGIPLDRGSNYTSAKFADALRGTQDKAVCRAHRDML